MAHRHCIVNICPPGSETLHCPARLLRLPRRRLRGFPARRLPPFIVVVLLLFPLAGGTLRRRLYFFGGALLFLRRVARRANLRTFTDDEDRILLAISLSFPSGTCLTSWEAAILRTPGKPATRRATRPLLMRTLFFAILRFLLAGGGRLLRVLLAGGGRLLRVLLAGGGRLRRVGVVALLFLPVFGDLVASGSS